MQRLAQSRDGFGGKAITDHIRAACPLSLSLSVLFLPSVSLLSFSLSLSPPLSLSTCLCLCVCLSDYLSVCLSGCLSVYLSVCPSVSEFIYSFIRGEGSPQGWGQGMWGKGMWCLGGFHVVYGWVIGMFAMFLPSVFGNSVDGLVWNN